MFIDSNGKKIHQDAPICGLLTFDPDKSIWKCLGTGFFINPLGGFITAKHVLFDNNGNHIPTLYAVQTALSGERHLRIARNFTIHPTADIAIGKLGLRREATGTNLPPTQAPIFKLDFTNLKTDDEVLTYAFPSTEMERDMHDTTFTFSGKWSKGNVIEYLEEGSPLVRNKCYHTSMFVESGASGGPVLRNGLVVGINSSSMQLGEEEGITYVTPVNYILDMKVKNGKEIVDVRDLINSKLIHVKEN